ncbi:MAG: hypothetical protein JWM16_5646 [Verrucomicrobiales bacterium]|nr:hypothetical protein [Verrucomicrobiales bacterium]
MADAQDLKSWGPLKGRVGSSPTTGTIGNPLIAKELDDPPGSKVYTVVHSRRVGGTGAAPVFHSCGQVLQSACTLLA